MSQGKRITFADIKRQMELASEDIETWPTWVRRAAGLDGEGPDYKALRAENARLQQLLEDVLHTFGYLRFHRVAGMDGLLYETHNKMSPERTVEACEKRIRATLTPAAGGTRHGTN